MTSITLTVTGARAVASVSGPLTAGMVGIPVTIRYDDAWSGLTKNLVCRCGRWESDRGESRTVSDVGETATVAHEVMQADMYLYLGLEGYRPDGKLVMPTTWASCGKVLYGADGGADPGTDPTLPVWAQMQGQIGQIRENLMTEEDVEAVIAAYLEENPVEDPNASPNKLTATAKTLLITILRNGVYNTDQSAHISALEQELIYGDGDAHTHSYAVTAFKAATCTADGVRTCTCSCGSSYTEVIPAIGHNFVDGVCTVCGAADGVTLTGISAAYSGGYVPAGTAVTDLTGIVVTATYSDGKSKTVTDYTLSGTIAAGENTVTVTYQGMSTTFTVIGAAENAGDDSKAMGNPFDSAAWSTGLYYYASGNTETTQANADYSCTDLVDVSGFSNVVCEDTDGSKLIQVGVHFYDADRNFVEGYDGSLCKDNAAYPSPLVIPIPENALYARVNLKTEYLAGLKLYVS